MKTKIKENNKNNKNGISLIVLVITIIVMIILAAAIILSLSSNGIIDRANEAVGKTDKAQIQTLASLAWSEAYLDGARTKQEFDYAVTEALKEQDITGYVVLVSEYGVEILDVGTDNWDVAYEYTDEGWSDRITAGAPLKGSIVAKLYKTGSQVKPPDVHFAGKTIKLDEDDEYIMIIEGTGDITDMMITDESLKIQGGVGWQYETALVAAGYADTSIIGYVSEIIIKKGITDIGAYAFGAAASLKKVSIPGGIISIKDSAFSMCSLLEIVTIPDSVISIGDSAFFGCKSLESVTIPNSVITIANKAFYNCDALTSVTIPDSVTNIGDRTFASCDNLTNVYYTGTEDEWKQITIGEYNEPLINANIVYNYVPN